MKSVLPALLLVLTFPVFAESRSEQVFAAAADWTVLVSGVLDTPFAEDEQGSWYGSGFVVDAERGWILTNAHVASHSPAVLTVSFQHGKPLKAERIYVDPYLDLAVLRIDTSTLKKAPKAPPLSCTAMPPTGHPVGAFGHPWGYKFTGTRGIVSAISSREGPDFIQTDAPVNEGNSGGALISLETGSVVGINTAMAVRQDKRAQGINFAVPMVHACHVLALLKGGRDPSPPARVVHFAIDAGDEHSLTVAQSRLPTQAIALQPGDTVMAVSGKPVRTEGEFMDAIRGTLQAVELTIERGGSVQMLKGQWPAAPAILEREGMFVAGALFSATTPSFSAFLDTKTALMIHHIEPGSEAQGEEIRTFDLLLSANGKPVDSLAALTDIVEAAEASTGEIELVLIRIASDDLFEYHRRVLPTGGFERISGRPKSLTPVVAR